MYGAVCLQPVYPPDQFVSMVRHVEDLGLGDLWLTDSSLHSRYCYSYLTLAAVNTSRVRLGTAVTNPVTRHPAMAAVGAATLDEISGGRAVFGIGAGDRPLDALGLKPARLGLLEDAILAARRLWSGEHVDMQARGFTLADAHLRFPARPDIPVYISASGPMTLELAGRIADGVILLAGLHPDGLSYALEHIDRGVDQAGRGARPKITVFAYGAIDEDEEVALAAGRTIAAWFPMTAPVYCELAGLSPELVAQVRRTREQGGRVVAVGTTVVRALETAMQDGELRPFSGETRIFIFPGYRIRSIDALVTNFHLPESTLLMLVSAFAGRERILGAYRHAVRGRYRFFSYGDAMLLFPGEAAG